MNGALIDYGSRWLHSPHTCCFLPSLLLKRRANAHTLDISRRYFHSDPSFFCSPAGQRCNWEPVICSDTRVSQSLFLLLRRKKRNLFLSSHLFGNLRKGEEGRWGRRRERSEEGKRWKEIAKRASTGELKLKPE